MNADLRIISIGTLAAHPLWGERAPVRTGHATCTLLRAGDVVMLIDPGLPDRAMVQRLAERANLAPEAVTHVFLTSFHPDTHRGIAPFERATWLVSKPEREGVGVPLVTALRHAMEQGNAELHDAVRSEVAILERCEEAPESLAEDVDVFPLPGVSPGMTGLLIGGRESTTLICGDALPTVEHLASGRIVPWASDLEAAKASFAEAIEIADFLVLGRDNIVPSPGGQHGGVEQFDPGEVEPDELEEPDEPDAGHADDDDE
ncbi:MAG: MBL fold metallo-hydrolase [Phycisphaerales bacterium]